MIVDDSSVIRKVARRILENAGCVVFDAVDGFEALQLCRGRIPDAIIVDWTMPGMSGIEFITEFKESFRDLAQNTSLIYCTHEMDIPNMAKAKRAGATHFIMKPFDQKTMLTKLSLAGLMPADVAA